MCFKMADFPQINENTANFLCDFSTPKGVQAWETVWHLKFCFVYVKWHDALALVRLEITSVKTIWK